MTEYPRLSYKSTFSFHDPTFRPAGLTDSKLGGAPYRPKGAGWPIAPDGLPYSFVAQLNLEQVERDRQSLGIPPLLEGALPTTGLLQFFLPLCDGWRPGCFVAYLLDYSYPADEPLFAWKADYDSPVVWVREIPHPEIDPRTQHLKFGAFYTELSLLCHPEVPQALEPVALEPMLQRPVPGLHIEAPEQESKRELRQSYLGECNHQVGGLANFVQNDPRPEGSPLRLLFQIEADHHMQWIGDSGNFQFFIDPADLARKDFRNVLADWTCC
ncbi:YwqG family protein [Corynebacterium sp. H130]|uniref:YwqG family protein n=1 Tax=Corynebacterium sp. H130 TaxID=3133444 RepID=UPI00309A0DF3